VVIANSTSAARSIEKGAQTLAVQDSIIRVLLVDDHPVVREGLRAMIETQKDMAVVGESENGTKAIESFHVLHPDILLLDLKLPDMDGVRVIEVIRATHPDARIIVLTTYVGDVQARRALRAGAMGYLLKASLRRDLRDSIRAVHSGLIKVQAEVATDLAQHEAVEHLTQREQEVLRLIASGLSNKLVAHRLSVREDTVKAHVSSILNKLKANDRTHAVTIALQRGFFEL
jgi:DNA-binding NarL/FixJ family response regulator